MKYTINGREVNRYEWAISTEDGIHKKHYDNGQLEFEISYQNRRLHGAERFLYFGQFRFKVWVNGALREDLLGSDMRLARVAIFGRDILL